MEFEDEGGERGKRQEQGMRAVLCGNLFGIEATEIADAGAPVVCGVRIEDFLVKAAFGDTDAVIAADDRRGIQNYDEKIFMISRAADEGDDAIIAIVAVNPFKTGPF